MHFIKKQSLKTLSTEQPAQILKAAVDLTQIDCHLAKMGLFKISKELQLRVCSHIDHVQVLSKNMERTLKEREEVESNSKQSYTQHWVSCDCLSLAELLLGKKVRFLLDSVFIGHAREPPLLIWRLYLIVILIRNLFAK